MNKEDALLKIKEFIENEGYGVDYYEEGDDIVGFDCEDWTNRGVDMLIFLDGRDNDDFENGNYIDWFINEWVEYVDNFDVDDEIELHRQGADYKNAFTIRQSLEDFEEWKERIEGTKDNAIKWRKSLISQN